MRESIVGLLDKADLAVASASGVIREDDLRPVAEAVRSLRLRLDYPEDLLIVAIAGGTGSGKSSLMNAIAGAEIAETGGIRPTTNEPMAVVPRSRMDAVSGYLVHLGLRRIVAAPFDNRLCLIDLPDIDSVEVDHRLQVDTLLPNIDAVIWVTDPEKYQDAVLHDTYLRPLASHGGRFVFALNQADRLSERHLQVVMSDLQDALVFDGIESPKVFAISAQPPVGPPLGIDRLMQAVQSLSDPSAVSRTLVDLDLASAALLASAGESGLDFETRATEFTDTAASLVMLSRLGEATDLLIGFLDDLARRAGGMTAVRIAEIAAGVPDTVRMAEEQIRPGRPDGRLGELQRRRAPSDEESEDRIAEWLRLEIVVPVREVVQRRAAAIAAITDLCLSVAMVRADMSV